MATISWKSNREKKKKARRRKLLLNKVSEFQPNYIRFTLWRQSFPGQAYVLIKKKFVELPLIEIFTIYH